jgi:hypothetical protein
MYLYVHAQCICMYVYVCNGMHVYVYICVYVYMYMCMHICLYMVETRKEARARKDADLRVLVCIYVCMYVYVRVYVCIYGWKLEKRPGHGKTLICVYW